MSINDRNDKYLSFIVYSSHNFGFIGIIITYKYRHLDIFVPRNNEYDMKADVNTLTNMFWDCNRKYFDNSLPTPYIELFDRPNIVARFEYRINGKKAKKPIGNQIIYFSKTYEFDENTMRDVMVHEMIHYYTAWNRIKDNGSHGRQFWHIAKEFNERYGLNVSST